MIRFEIIIILLGMSSGTVLSEDLKPNGAYGRFKNPGLFVMEGGDILKLTAFYALDGNVNTAAELSSYNEGSAFAPLELFLLSPLFVNQLSLTTGACSNQLVTKPRDVMVRAWQTVDGEEKSVYSNQFSLADTLQPQKLDLGQMVKADHWEVQPLAVYLSPEDPLSKNRRAAIAELKLGNNSQVYEIKNLVEAEKTFLYGYIQNLCFMSSSRLSAFCARSS